MKKIFDFFTHILGWETHKDIFFWIFVTIWLFVDILVFSCIYDNPNIDSKIVMILINFFFLIIVEVLTIIKCKGGKFNDWLNIKIKK